MRPRDSTGRAGLLLGQNPWRLQREILTSAANESLHSSEVVPPIREDVQRRGGNALGLGPLAGVTRDHNSTDLPAGKGAVE